MPRPVPLLLALLCLLASGLLHGLAAEEAAAIHVAFHDVTDLIDLPVASLGLGAGSQPGGDTELARDESDGNVTEQALEAAVWQELGTLLANARSRVSGRFGGLLIAGSLEAHQRTHAFLSELRRRRHALTRAEVIVARCRPAPIIALLDAAGTARPVEVGDSTGFALDDAQLSALEAALAEGGDAELVDRLSLRGAGRERFGWHRKLECAYIEDLELRFLSSQAIADPRVGTLWLGYALGLTPGVADRQFDLHLEVRTLEALEQLATGLGPIQVPTQRTATLAAPIELPAAGALLLAGLADPFPLSGAGRAGAGSDRSLFVVIRPLAPPAALPLGQPPAWLTDDASRARRLDPAELQGEVTLVIHDVRDLVSGVHDFLAPDLELAGGEPDQPGETEEPATAAGDGAAEPAGDGTAELAAWLRENVAPRSWSAASVSLQAMEDSLVIRQRPAVHDLITEVLTDLRRGSSRLVTIEARILQVQEGRRTSLGAKGLTLDGHLHPWGNLADPAPILAAAGERSGVSVLTAPRLAVFPSQRASIMIVNQIAYIADFDVQVVPGAAGAPETLVGDPVVEVLQDGLALEMAAIPTPDNRELLIELDLQLGEAEQPIASTRIPMGAAGAEIQLPHARATRMNTALRLPAGQSALLAIPGSPGASVGQVLLLTVNLTSVEDR